MFGVPLPLLDFRGPNIGTENLCRRWALPSFEGGEQNVKLDGRNELLSSLITIP